jgi:hypothetical protein
MKFGIFYEHQIPRPLDADAEHRTELAAVANDVAARGGEHQSELNQGC